MQLSRAARIRAVFFLHAISSGGLYSHVAEVQRALHVDAATLGLVFLGFPIGSMLVFLFGSRVLEAAGTKPILIFGTTGLPVATALFAVMPTPIALFTFFIGYALFYSLPNMAMNVEADRVEAASPRRVMNSCHGVWSVGYLLATLLGTIATALQMTPITHLALLAAPLVPIALFVFFIGYALFYSLPNMAMNIEADRVENASPRRVMNSCHGVWSIGYLLATLLGTLATALHMTPVMHLGLLAVPLVTLGLFITAGIDPAPPRPHTAQVVRRLSLPTIPILLLVAFTIGPNMLEGSLRNWSIIYMRDSFAAPNWVDTLTLPVFLLAQSIGRLNADGFVTRYGPVRVARAL
ncbi:MAG TPA: hypothetical protein VFE64_06365, partial [Devosia sp.]|nr:hypothetical protein [Devosia sp.]